MNMTSRIRQWWKLGRHIALLSLVSTAALAVGFRASAAEPNASGDAIFNGRDLTGWQAEGHAVWEVTDGLLVGRQDEQNRPGDLLTKEEFKNFELTVVYRMVWPGNSGVWYRYQSADKAFQADILEYKNPLAYSGSLYCTGKMFLARNTDPKLEKHDGWNTLVIRAEGDHQQITLNGKLVADVHDDTTDHGRIGFQVHPGKEFAKMRIIVKSARIKRL